MPPPMQCKLTIYSYLFARWHLFRHVGYLRHQQQVNLWPLHIESGVRVTCDVGYLCANFSLPIDLSVLELRPMYATDARQTDVRQRHRLMPPPYGGGGIIIQQSFYFHFHWALCNSCYARFDYLNTMLLPVVIHLRLPFTRHVYEMKD